MRTPDYYWRLAATGLCFAGFGVGGILLSFAVFPIVHLLSASRTDAQHRCQHMVHWAFRLFIWSMRSLGVLTYEIHGKEKLRASGNRLIVANHPSLIDVVFVIAMVPRTFCVVKKAAWANPVMAGVMWATGYISNRDPQCLIEDGVDCLARGDNLVLFPESTRTVPGQPMKLRRGAANILVKSRHPFVPIAISSEPTTLTKAEKWYQIPAKRVHFKISVGDPIDPTHAMVEGEAASLATRRMNRFLKAVLVKGVECHANNDR